MIFCFTAVTVKIWTCWLQKVKVIRNRVLICCKRQNFVTKFFFLLQKLEHVLQNNIGHLYHIMYRNAVTFTGVSGACPPPVRACWSVPMWQGCALRVTGDAKCPAVANKPTSSGPVSACVYWRWVGSWYASNSNTVHGTLKVSIVHATKPEISATKLLQEAYCCEFHHC